MVQKISGLIQKALLILILFLCLGNLRAQESGFENWETSQGPASATSFIAHSKKINAIHCGDPFVNRGGQCVLESNSDAIEMDQTYEIGPFVKLNCQGKPLVPGPNFGADQPAFFSSSNGWKLQNCNVGTAERPFPFAVVIFKNSLSQETLDDPGARSLTQIKILGNHFITDSISLLSLEGYNYAVKNNSMCCRVGVAVIRRSSHIEIKDNAMDQTAVSPASLRLWPGSPLFAGVPPPVLAVNYSVFGPFPPSFTVLVDGKSFDISADLNNVLLDEIVIAGNTVNTALGSGGFAGAVHLLDGVRDSEIRGNTITSAGDFGINLSGVFSPPSVFPSENIRVKDNKIFGTPVTGLRAFVTNDSLFQGNTVSGATTGILIRGFARENSTWSENSVSGGMNSVVIDYRSPASFFGAHVFLNEFTGSAGAPIAVVGTPSSTELSAGGLGNYWGLTCAQGHPAGFPASPSLPLLSDSFAFGEPVLELFDDRLVLKDPLPLTCDAQGS